MFLNHMVDIMDDFKITISNEIKDILSSSGDQPKISRKSKHGGGLISKAYT